MVRRSEAEWVGLGERAILDMLGDLHAALTPELPARISEGRWKTFPRVDANHITTARDNLLRRGNISVLQEPTRGGRAVVDAYHLPFARGNRTRIERVAAHKRLMFARWFGWAVGDTRYPSGFVGTGGERALRESLLATERHLWAPVSPGFGPASHLLGTLCKALSTLLLGSSRGPAAFRDHPFWS